MAPENEDSWEALLTHALLGEVSGRSLTLAEARAVVRAHEASAFDGEAFDDSSLLVQSWTSLLLQQLKLPRALRLPDEQLRAIRTLLHGYTAGSGATVKRIHAIMKKAEQMYHQGQLIRSENIMSLFRTAPDVTRANERHILTSRAMHALSLRKEESAEPLSLDEATTISERFDELATERNIQLVIPGDLFDRGALDEPFPQFSLPVAGVQREFRGALRTAPRSMGDTALVDALTRALRDYQRRDAFRDTLRTAYYVSLTAHPTSVDASLPDYFDWLNALLDPPTPTFFSDLHRETTVGGRSIVAMIASLEESVTDSDASAEDRADTVEETLRQLLAQTRWERLRPGVYDLVRAVGQSLFGVPHPTPTTNVALSRLI